MNGGNGWDTIYLMGSAANVDLRSTSSFSDGHGGSDTISTDFEEVYGSSGGEWITGQNSVNNVLHGGGGNDTIDGNNGDDILEGGAGNDNVYGGGNTDTATYENAAAGVTVNISSGASNDGDGGSDTFNSIENVIGSQFGDTITGDGNANILKGLGGNDTISAGNGNDILYGGAGTDSLTGGSNADTFVFEIASAFSNQDTIADFSTAQGDKIDIHDVIDVEFDPVTEAISQFVDFTNSGCNSIMSIDRDGTGTAYGFVNVATLTGVTNLDETTLYNNGNLLAS